MVEKGGPGTTREEGGGEEGGPGDGGRYKAGEKYGVMVRSESQDRDRGKGQKIEGIAQRRKRGGLLLGQSSKG